MTIAWTDDLATGSAEIDDQHKELFKRIDALMEACRQGKGKNEVIGVIQFLDDYVITHFSEEEEYMQRYGYPDYAAHKAQHLEFMSTFSDLKKQVEQQGPGVHLVIQIKDMIVEWLLRHIRKVDKALGSFLKTKIKPA
jgi:hemerythrin